MFLIVSQLEEAGDSGLPPVGTPVYGGVLNICFSYTFLRFSSLFLIHDSNKGKIKSKTPIPSLLLVLDGVRGGETHWGPGNPARATTLMSESERQGNRQSSGQLSSSDA